MSGSLTRKPRRQRVAKIGRNMTVSELASLVEGNVEELMGLISLLQRGHLTMPTSRPDNPEDGEFYLSTSGGTRYINVYNASTGSFESAALS